MKTTRKAFALLTLVAVVGLQVSCNVQKKSSAVAYPSFFKQGHRGTRGLMTENTIASMTKAIEVGANTIELDVHISKDNKVVVYHDASINPVYTTLPGGDLIPKEDRSDYIFYKMDYDQIRKFEVGSLSDPKYPEQKAVNSYVPLLSELIDSVEAFTKANNLKPVFYNVEIKSSAKSDGVEQPAPEEYMRILMDVLNGQKLGKRLIIQSFDARPLQVLHKKYPELALGYLVSNKKSLEENLAELGFIPTFYNPNYHMLSQDLVDKCHAKDIMINPWTVNTAEEIERMKSLGVDGIITDYPNLLSEN